MDLEKGGIYNGGKTIKLTILLNVYFMRLFCSCFK